MQTESISREVDRAWLAAIFDGEGTMTSWFGAQYEYKHKLCQGRHLVTRGSVLSTDARIIKKLSEILTREDIKYSYSLKIDRRPNRRPTLNVIISGKGNMHKLLEITLPYVAKKERSIALLEIIDYREKLAQEYGDHNQRRRHQYWRGPVEATSLLENNTHLQDLISALRQATLPIDPSETKRQAGQPLVLS